MNKINLESRQYFEDSNEEEINALKSRIYLYKPNIIYFHEISKPSEFTVDLLFDETEKYIKKMKRPGMLIDIRDASVPNSKIRSKINERFKGINEHVEHVAYCIGGNLLIQAAARFVMFNTKLNSYSIHRSIESAEDVLIKKLNY